MNNEQRELDKLRILFNAVKSVNETEINTDFGDGFDAKAFMEMSLPERFHAYMVMEICSEDDFQENMRKNNYDYLPMLYRVKQELPGDFYAYFHDLLHEKEIDFYHKKYLEALNGMI